MSAQAGAGVAGTWGAADSGGRVAEPAGLSPRIARKVANLTIEITGKCNLHCTHCAQARLQKDKQFGAIMPPELFNRILDHLIHVGIIDPPGSPNGPVHVVLYSWGEPLLHPKINEILRMIKDKQYRANFSANLGHLPNLDRDILPVIGNFTLSLSGFTQDSYGRIHGQDLRKVLDHFEKMYADLRTYSPETIIKISWHEYRFNGSEFWDAHRYFDRPGISMEPVVAFLNDGRLMVDFLQGRMPAELLAEAKKNIDIDAMRKRGEYHRRKSANYYCKQWDYLMIDELGRLLTCCSFSGFDPGIALGNVLDMSAAEISERKQKATACGECVSSGAARFIHKLDDSIPSGGGLYGMKVRAAHAWAFHKKKFTLAYLRRKVSRIWRGAMSQRARPEQRAGMSGD